MSSEQANPEHAVYIPWASNPAPRTFALPSCGFASFVVQAFDLLHPAQKPKKPPRTPAGISGTHKNLRSPCNLPNLFSCQISSSSTYVDLAASAAMGLTHSRFMHDIRSASNPMFDASNR